MPEEEKREGQSQGGQPPQKGIEELMAPVESIPDGVIKSKAGSVFMKLLYGQECRKVVELQSKLEDSSNENRRLDKDNVRLKDALETKHFLDFVSSILIATALVLIEKAIEHKDNFLWLCAGVLLLVSIIMMWRFISPKHEKEEQKVT